MECAKDVVKNEEDVKSSQKVKRYQAIYSHDLSGKYEPRYVIVDTETGEIVDDAQGYGYKSKENAYKAWGYKSKVKNPKKHKNDMKKKVMEFKKEHKGLMKRLDDLMFYAFKDNEKITNKDIKGFLKENGIEELPFTINELLKY